MKKLQYFLIALITVTGLDAQGQGIYFEPDPTDVTSSVRLYVDISSDDCQCPNVHPVSKDDPLYIWTWIPNEDRPLLFGNVDVSNGDWGNSNDNMVMKQDENDPNLWYFDFLTASPAQFYDAEPAVFYENGIHFLVKKKNGNGDPEPKSEDLSIIPEPVGCVEVICPFPLTFFDDEYVIFTYDNNQESNPGLQNMGPTDAYMTFRYSVNGGPEQVFPPSGGDPLEVQMDFDGEGIFSFTMIPKDFFPVEPGDEITSIRPIVTKLPLPAPPFRIPDPLLVGCPPE